MAENEQITQITANDSLRQELEGKIEKKLPASFFYWVMGVMIMVLLAVFGMIASSIGKANDTVNELNTRTAVIESKIK